MHTFASVKNHFQISITNCPLGFLLESLLRCQYVLLRIKNPSFKVTAILGLKVCLHNFFFLFCSYFMSVSYDEGTFGHILKTATDM